MSAPGTNTKREARRHRIPLIGIAASLVFAFVVAVALIGVMSEADITDQDQVNPVTEAPAAQN